MFVTCVCCVSTGCMRTEVKHGGESRWTGVILRGMGRLMSNMPVLVAYVMSLGCAVKQVSATAAVHQPDAYSTVGWHDHAKTFLLAIKAMLNVQHPVPNVYNR